MTDTTTIEIDKDTHNLVKQYCLINNIRTKDFIKELTEEKLQRFKQKLEEMKKINL